MIVMTTTDHIEFGPFRLDILNMRLWRDYQPVALRPRALAVLRYLVERPLQLVTKEELLQHIWTETHVSRTVLRVCIREIRLALGDRVDDPAYVETVGRRGYRFLQRSQVVMDPLRVLERARQHHMMIGRQREIDHLQMGLTAALHGERQLVFISGEAGVGKTTIIDTFIAQIVANPEVWVGRGQCIEYSGPGEAYLPVLEALGQLGDRPDGEQLVDVLRQVAPTWLPHLPAWLREDEREQLQRQGQSSTQARMLRELTIALERFTAQTPLVLVFEDLHWSDPSTVDLLTFLANRQEAARLLVVGTYRPAESVMHHHPLVNALRELHGQRRCMELTVPPLSVDHIALYAENTLGGPVTPTVADLLSQRTEGNALFVAHLLTDLVRQGVVTCPDGTWMVEAPDQALQTDLPEGLRPLLTKQIEGLTLADQRLLEAASVVGDTFAVAAIAAGVRFAVEDVEVMCETLARQSHLIEETGLARWPDGTVSGTYRFHHALYRQAVYERISPGRRVLLHRQLGARLEAGFRGCESDIASELAHHFIQGETPDRALQYHRLAGEKALKRYAPQETVAHCTAGLGLIPFLSEGDERLQHELALQTMLGPALIAIHGYTAPQVAAVFLRARSLCQEMAPSPQLSPILFGLFAFHTTRGESKESYNFAEQLFEFTQSQQDAALVLAGQLAMGIPKFLLGQLIEARQHIEQALALYDSHRHETLTPIYGQDLGVVALSYLAWVLSYLGHPEQALRRSAEALALAQEREHPFSQTFALTFAARLHKYFRQADAAREVAEAALEMTEIHGFPYFWAHAAMVHEWALAELDDQAKSKRNRNGKSKCIDQIEEGMMRLRARGAKMVIPQYHCIMAEIYQMMGNITEGLRVMDEALMMVKQCGMAVYEPELLRLKGELLVSHSKHQHAEAAELFHQAIGVARAQHAMFCELRAAMSLYRLSKQQGKPALAREHLVSAYSGFTEGFHSHSHNIPDLQEAKLLLADL